MDNADIDAIVTRLFDSFNHSSNAACRDMLLDVLRNDPRRLDPLLFQMIYEHARNKAWKNRVQVLTWNPELHTAIITRLLGRIQQAESGM